MRKPLFKGWLGRGMLPLMVLGVLALAAAIMVSVLAAPGAAASTGNAAGLTVTAGDEAVHLNWEPSADEGTDGYIVFRRTEDQRKWRTLAETTGDGTVYLDRTAQNDTTYFYRVVAYDTANEGGGTPYLDSANWILPAPHNVSAELEPGATGGLDGVRVSFAVEVLPDTDLATTFPISRNGEHLAYVVNTIPGEDGRYTHLDTTATVYGQTYSYQIWHLEGYRTYDEDFRSMAPATVEITLPIPSPSGLTASMDKGGIALEWEPSEYAGTSVTGHQIYRMDPNTNGEMVVYVEDTGTAQRGFRDLNIAENAKYVYRVAELYNGGTTPGYKSNRVAIATRNVPALTAPANLQVAVGGTEASLTWDSMADTVYGYQVERVHDGQTDLLTGRASLNEYTDTSLTLGETYTYRVMGLDFRGAGPASESTVTLPNMSPGVPNAPQVHIHAGSAVLQWDAAENASTYQVYRRDAGGTEWTAVGEPVSETSYTDSTIEAGNGYEYSVQASNSTGTSAQSEASGVNAPALPPQLTGLTGVQSAGRIALSWEQPDSLASSEGFGGFSVSRLVYTSEDMATLAESSTISQSAEDAAASPGVVDSNIMAGHHYVYTVSAVNSMGTGQPSDAYAVTLAQQPASPGHITSTVNDDGNIVLTWADPGDSEITGYRIHRRLPQRGETKMAVHVSDTMSTETTFTDERTHPSTQNVYRVSAVRGAVVGPWSSFTRIRP